MMFDESAYHAGGPFWTQGQLPAAAVFEDVHFFLDNVGGFAQGTMKQLQRFERRRADLLKAEKLKQLSRLGFERLELGGVGGQNVVRPANRLKFHTDRDYTNHGD